MEQGAHDPEDSKYGDCYSFSIPELRLCTAIPKEVLGALFVETYEVPEISTASILYSREDRDIVLDAGGGIGFVASIISGLADYIVIVEPIQAMHKIIRANMLANNRTNFLLLDGAVGPEAKTVQFEERYLPYASSLEKSGALDPVKSTYPVVVRPINDLILEYGINAIQLDVEGAEADILPMLEYRPLRKLAIEMHPHLMGSAKCSELLGFPARAGMKLVSLAPPKAFPDKCYVVGFAREPIARRIRSRPGRGAASIIGRWTDMEGEPDAPAAQP